MSEHCTITDGCPKCGPSVRDLDTMTPEQVLSARETLDAMEAQSIDTGDGGPMSDLRDAIDKWTKDRIANATPGEIDRLLTAIVDDAPPLHLDPASYAIAQALEDDVAAVESGTADERADRRDFQNVPPQYGEQD